MSRIDDVIRESCPRDVEFDALGELLTYEQPTKYLVASTAYNDSYATPVLTAGQTFILGRTDETTGVYPASPATPVVIFDDFTTAFKWVDFAFKAKSSAMKMLTPKNPTRASLRYIYYAMQTVRYEPQDHARQWIGTYSGFRIPVPPLEVQREIVRILDNFTELTAELEAELALRSGQYDYYRNRLLDFPRDSVARAPLREHAMYVRGVTYPKTEEMVAGTEGHRLFRSNNIDVNTNRLVLEDVRVIRSDVRVRDDQWLRRGDVLISAASGSRAHVGKVAFVPGDMAYTFGGFMAVLRTAPKLHPRFLFHLLASTSFSNYLDSTIASTTINNLTWDIVGNFEVPLPSLEVQQQVLDTLDKFDALVNDLSVGLPAELAARRKQYEYYRDKLLTFKELAA